jgi:hypothetical protein
LFFVLFFCVGERERREEERGGGLVEGEGMEGTGWKQSERRLCRSPPFRRQTKTPPRPPIPLITKNSPSSHREAECPALNPISQMVFTEGRAARLQ